MIVLLDFCARLILYLLSCYRAHLDTAHNSVFGVEDALCDETDSVVVFTPIRNYDALCCINTPYTSARKTPVSQEESS
jgi:hypothetical protein